MGLLNRLFASKDSTTGFKMIADVGHGFYAWDGKLFQSDIVRSCIRPKAKAIGKMMAKHVRKDKEGLKVNPEPYMRFLLEEPNPYMTGQMLQEKLAIQLSLNNNAFAVIFRDDNGLPNAIYPIVTHGVEVKYDKAKRMQLRFTLNNGRTMTFCYSDIIHLRHDYHSDDIFGESPAKALASLMEVVNTTDQGIVQAIKNSNIIRWIMRFKTAKRPEDAKKDVEEFTKDYLSVSNKNANGGVIPSGHAYEMDTVDQKSYVPNALQMDRTIARLYNFFGTNEKIVQSKFNEDEWNAYYEAEVEPDALQLSSEYTRKLFTRKQRGHGNKVVFSSISMQYASMANKLNLEKMVDRGALTPNEWREILNLGPIPGGDEPIRRLDTRPVEEGGGKKDEDTD